MFYYINYPCTKKKESTAYNTLIRDTGSYKQAAQSWDFEEVKEKQFRRSCEDLHNIPKHSFYLGIKIQCTCVTMIK